jgi:hypothetical protein
MSKTTIWPAALWPAPAAITIPLMSCMIAHQKGVRAEEEPWPLST